jgi:TolA-binding protein
MLRGLCLERTKFYLDAAQTYQYIINEFPKSEYAYRAKARIETLRILKFIPGPSQAQALPAKI